MSPIPSVMLALLGVGPAAPSMVSLPPGPEWVLTAETPQVLEIPGLERFAVSSLSGVAVTSLGGDRLSVTVGAVGGGVLDVWVSGTHRSVALFARWDHADSPVPLDHLPFTHSAVRGRVVLKDLVLDGELGSLADAAALEALTQRSEHVLPFVRLREPVLRAALDDLDAHFGSVYRVGWAGERVVLRPRAAQVPNAEALAWVEQTWGPLERLAQAGKVWIEPATTHPPPELIQLGVGTQKIISVGNLQWFGTGDPSPVVVKAISSHQLLVVGDRNGSGSLLVRTTAGVSRYQVKVISRSGICGVCEICKYFGRSMDDFYSGPNLSMRMVGDRLFFDGWITSRDEVARLNLMHRLYPNIVMLARVSDDLRREVQRQANDDLARLGMSGQVVTAGRLMQVEGPSADPFETGVRNSIAHAYLDPMTPYL